jgi:hypothetical protein
VPALKAADHIGPLAQPIDDLSLALVAPLRADDHDICHLRLIVCWTGRPERGVPGCLETARSYSEGLSGKKPLYGRIRWTQRHHFEGFDRNADPNRSKSRDKHLNHFT